MDAESDDDELGGVRAAVEGSSMDRPAPPGEKVELGSVTIGGTTVSVNVRMRLGYYHAQFFIDEIHPDRSVHSLQFKLNRDVHR
jgi:hypothetical protein